MSVVINSLTDKNKLRLTLSEARALCRGRHTLFGNGACTGDKCEECMFHDKDGCRIEGEPRYWMSDIEDRWNIRSKDDALQMIVDLADDYDNAASVESLKDLIDELVEVAKYGRKI